MSNTVRLAQELIRRESVTPDDAGCQPLLCGRLEAQGFTTQAFDSRTVTNRLAVHGADQGAPFLVFMGHTDVVPTGDPEQWQIPPFEGRLAGGYLHGRGAADMKSSLAAMVVAAEQFVQAHPQHRGRLGVLLTSDEEGPAKEGTVRVLRQLVEAGDCIDMAVVGEPSSQKQTGDTIKNGRRGSLLGYLRILGKQGHVAYPHLADNPVHGFAAALQDLVTTVWDDGNAFFPPTSFQIANMEAGTGATNVIPGQLDLQFSFRFSTEVSADALETRVRAILDQHELSYELQCELSGQPFLTASGSLVEAAMAAVESQTGLIPELSTAGGTSDGRFVAAQMPAAQILELGPVNATIHQVDEKVRADELDTLTAMYYGIMERVLL